MRKIKKITDFGRISWIEALERAVLAMNLSFYRAIGTSPYILRFGTSYMTQVDSEFASQVDQATKNERLAKRDKIFCKYKKSIVKGTRDIKDNFSVGESTYIYKKPQKGKFK
ncbi:hypothetical protein NGRA_1534 [Nosema granulosis]|uniref:Uncharacterized protein n=1 Tax=Nosema granulosis TaxID=83296 RepID=A0A9P6GZV7_9MICR|nr:hypothetical protein NGRA_1534 [Nosema granulosis]